MVRLHPHPQVRSMSDERGEPPALPGLEVSIQLGEGTFGGCVGTRIQVWGATGRVGAATEGADGRAMALFRCAQMVLW